MLLKHPLRMIYPPNCLLRLLMTFFSAKHPSKKQMRTPDCSEQLMLDLPSFMTFDALCSSTNQQLRVHLSRRLKNSWYCKIHRNTPHRELFVPTTLADAPETVKTALIAWATLPSPRRRTVAWQEVRQKRQELESTIKSYLVQTNPTAGRKDIDPKKWLSKGEVYDLTEVFSTINATYFGGTLTAYLRWGSSGSKTSYQISHVDTAGKPYHTITIAGIYNHPSIPRYAIEAIMHHEMLHIHVPPERAGGRNIIHGRAFKKIEHAFPHYQRWHAWEKSVMPTLLRTVNRKRVR